MSDERLLRRLNSISDTLFPECSKKFEAPPIPGDDTTIGRMYMDRVVLDAQLAFIQLVYMEKDNPGLNRYVLNKRCGSCPNRDRVKGTCILYDQLIRQLASEA